MILIWTSSLPISDAECSATVEALKSLEKKVSSLTSDYSATVQALESMETKISSLSKLISDGSTNICTLRISPTHKNIDGARWTRFWWYEGTGWPPHETDVLGG